MAVSEDQGSVKSEDSLTGRAKFLCSYGGRIMPRPHDSQLRYVGGETRILSVQRSILFMELMNKLKNLSNNENVCLKYQLPNEDLDALVSVLSEEDLENMMEEYDRIESKDSSSRLRLFLFPASGKQTKVETPDHAVDPENKFVEAVNGIVRKADPPTTTNEARKLGNILPATPTPPVAEKQAAAALSHHVPVVPTPQVLVPQVPYIPAATTPALVPPVLGPSTLVPPVLAATATAPISATNPAVPPSIQTVATQPAAQVLQAQVAPPVAPVFPRVLTAPKGAATVQTAPVVRVAGPGGAPIAVVPTQLVGARQVPQVVAPRPVLPQVAAVAPSPSSARPGYVPLVDVSRGMLPKGRAIRQFSAEDDTASSQSSQVTTATVPSELMELDRRDSAGDEVEEPSPKTAADPDKHLMPKLQDLPAGSHERYVVTGTQKNKVTESHLERYLTEQTMGDTASVATHPHFYIPDAHRQQQAVDTQVLRLASTPGLAATVDVHGKHLQRQFTEHQQDNSPASSVRPPQVPCAPVQQHHPLPAEVAVQIDERLNGVIRPQHQQLQQQQLQPQQLQQQQLQQQQLQQQQLQQQQLQQQQLQQQQLQRQQLQQQLVYPDHVSEIPVKIVPQFVGMRPFHQAS